LSAGFRWLRTSSDLILGSQGRVANARTVLEGCKKITHKGTGLIFWTCSREMTKPDPLWLRFPEHFNVYVVCLLVLVGFEPFLILFSDLRAVLQMHKQC